jgi:hypothetical protein
VSGRWNHGDGTIWNVAMFASKLLSPINCCQIRALVGHLAAVRATWRLHMAIQEKSIMGPRVRVFDAAVQLRNLPLDPVLSDLAGNVAAGNKSE